MGLKDKLKLYDKDGTREPDRSLDDIEAKRDALRTIGGECLESEDGVIWRFRTEYDRDKLISSVHTEWEDGLGLILKYNELIDNVQMDDLLFLDLETTALNIGAGNYPFLIGIGYLKENVFTVDQYFMEDFSCEGAILKHLLPSFQNAKAFVSFNGKTFDVPVIKNRYRINRIPGYPVDKMMIDLIHPSRRIFKRLYESCSLQTLEEHVLGIPRHDDIPGWLIPDAYFSFQRFGEMERIPKIIDHNKQDICSMVLLIQVLNKIYRIIENKEYDLLHRRSLLNIANFIYRINYESFLDLANYIGHDIFKERSLFKKYSTVLKRVGKLEEALTLWKEENSIYSLEELAKHYEHREKDFERALECCDNALSLIGEQKFSSRGEDLDLDVVEKHTIRFEKRIKRLKRKLDKKAEKI